MPTRSVSPQFRTMRNPETPMPPSVAARRRIRSMLAHVLAVIALVACGPVRAADEVATALMERFSDRIYQIRVIDLASGNRSSLGSGFLVRADGTLATNFHVVAEFVHSPERFRLEYSRHDDSTGVLNVLDVDVVNDLALLTGAPAGEALQLTTAPVRRGDPLYSKIGRAHV